MPGIYVHIPFCRQKCSYCDFTSYTNVSYVHEYLKALKAEINTYAAMLESRRFQSIFIGGGTPSLLPEGAVSSIISSIKAALTVESDCEITIECNPESITLPKLSEYLNCGVNRLSIGLQSADDAVLQTIGRIHNLDDFLIAYRSARKAGFKNINVDVIHGLPEQTEASYIDTLKLLCELKPEHISSYSLILDESTPLYTAVNNGCLALPDPESTADMEDAGMAFLEQNGYRRYEISNYSLPGRQCRHNLNYWDNGEYIGFGAAACSALRIDNKWIRFSNKPLLDEYINLALSGKPAIETTENIERYEEIFESIMLGLRKCAGLSRSAFKKRFGSDVCEIFAAQVSELMLDNMLVYDDERVFLTKRGLDFQNEVLLKFLQ